VPTSPKPPLKNDGDEAMNVEAGGKPKRVRKEEAWKVQLCGIPGHWKYECRSSKKIQEGGGSEKPAQNSSEPSKPTFNPNPHLQILQWMIFDDVTLMVDIDDIAEFDENIDDNADWGIPLASLLDL